MNTSDQKPESFAEAFFRHRNGPTTPPVPAPEPETPEQRIARLEAESERIYRREKEMLEAEHRQWLDNLFARLAAEAAAREARLRAARKTKGDGQ